MAELKKVGAIANDGTKETELGVTAELNESEELKGVEPVETTAPTDELTDAEETAEETKEEPKADEATEPTQEPVQEVKKGAIKHAISFLGNGIWRDKLGVCWARTSNGEIISDAVFTDKEYKNREDIHFMVEYGAMKEVIV